MRYLYMFHIHGRRMLTAHTTMSEIVSSGRLERLISNVAQRPGEITYQRVAERLNS